LVVHLALAGTDATVATEPVRAGFVVGRTIGGAVVRNTVRRRLRHLLRHRLDRLPPGARVVVRARPEAAHAPSTVLARDLDSALDRALMRV
ncbi:MAG: ribonuclease P protein component, partial [Jiangellaceae bacterium]